MTSTEHSAAPSYWHGGYPGLAIGDHILSPEDAARAGIQTGYTPRDPAELGRVSRTDRVYFASERDFARSFASQTEITMPSGTVISRGTLYRVEPVGPVDEDPDFAGRGVSWCSRRATVVDVEEVDVRMRSRDATRAVGQYSEWDDGRPMYQDDGRLTLTWQMEGDGITQADVDELVRPWTHHTIALERITNAAFAGKIGSRSRRGRS